MVESIKLHGLTSGDWSVGIGQSEFSIDFGLTELSNEDRDFIEETIIRDMWELHDNGDLKYCYNDEEGFRYMNATKSGEILKKHGK